MYSGTYTRCKLLREHIIKFLTIKDRQNWVTPLILVEVYGRFKYVKVIFSSNVEKGD